VNALDPNLLLLDSCSMVNLISNRNMLTHIHHADTPLQVRCNAGTKCVTMMGTFGDFPEQVWYDPHGAANILSLYTVSKHYAVTYDSSQDDTFHVTNAQGDTYHFAPTGLGLYAHQCTPGLHWAFISMVAGNAMQYSHRAQTTAKLARRIQNIIMFPSTRQYQHIVDHNLLPNCPVQWADIQAADHIYGANLGSLKGKTVTRPGVPIDPTCDPIPETILEHCASVILSIDIMYVNGIAFLVTTSHTIQFGTIESIPNHQVTTVVKALGHVLALYRR